MVVAPVPKCGLNISTVRTAPFDTRSLSCSSCNCTWSDTRPSFDGPAQGWKTYLLQSNIGIFGLGE